MGARRSVDGDGESGVLRKGSKEVREIEDRDAFHLIQIELAIGVGGIVRPVAESEVRRRQLNLLPAVRKGPEPGRVVSSTRLLFTEQYADRRIVIGFDAELHALHAGEFAVNRQDGGGEMLRAELVGDGQSP